ncbi:AraC family transcriptional regulator [Niveibacterium terrae]|uniref:AraC family transcriptional regulator n=1 Tax=Niveibacterium terrae TaxID=3373598 RepID=UPI003A94DE2B
MPPEQLIANIVPHAARSLLGLVEDRGKSPERLCRGLGFTYQDLLNRELLLSSHQTRALIVRAQQMLDEPALGLAAGARQTPVSWGVLGLAMLTCETFGEAIAYAQAFQREGGAMADHQFEANDREMFLELRPHAFDMQTETFLIEEAFASALAVGRYLVGRSLNPLRVDFAFERPAHAEVYRRFFHCPVRFGSGINRMSIEAHWLTARLPGYDRISCSLLREQLKTLLTQPIGRPDLMESLANRIRFNIEDGPRQKELATMMNVSDRSLRRRLAQHNTSYRSLRDSTRFERADDLLTNSDMTIAQVAEAVGYADARAFRRAFKRWSGLLPAGYRQNRTAPGK